MADHRLEIVLAGKDASKKAFRSVTSRIKGFTKSVVNMRNVAVGAAGAAGLGYMIKQSLEAADSIAKTADSIGISTDALQEYRYIAERSGVATSKLDGGLQTFTKRLGELRAGSGALNTYLSKTNEELAEQLKQANSTDQALRIYFDALKDIENQSDRNAHAAAAFSKANGAAMTNMVGSIEDLRDRYDRLGIEIDEKLLRRSEQAKDSLDDLSDVIRSSFQRALITLAPEIGQAADNMADWVTNNQELIESDLPRHLSNIAGGVMAVGRALSWVASETEKTAEWWAEAIYGPADAGDRIREQIEELEKRARKLRETMVENPEAAKRMGLGKELKKVLDRQNQLRDTLDMMETSAKKADTSVRDYAKAWDDAANTVPENIGKITRAQQEAAGQPPPILAPKVEGKPADMADAIPADMFADARRYIEDTRTPLERFNREIERLYDMREAMPADIFPQKTFVRAVDQAWQTYDRRLGDMEDRAGEAAGEAGGHWADMTDRMANAFDGWANSYSKTLNDMLWDSELTFDGILESFGKMITEMLIQSAMADVSKALFGSNSQGGTGGGWFSGSGEGDGGKAGMVQQGANWAMTALQNYFSMHDGGTVGKDGTPGIAPAGLWNNAPRLHNGLAPDEFPAILQRGEHVIPKNQAQDSGGRQQINVKNINVLDPSIVGDYMATAEGEEMIVNVVQKNREALQ